jgi:hypothetical protein
MSNRMDRDELLNRVLQRWQTPSPSPALDRRVIASFRAQTRKRAPWRWQVWLPVAAALLAAAIFLPRIAHPSRSLELHSVWDPATTTYVTEVTAAGFLPAPEGTITVTGGKP